MSVEGTVRGWWADSRWGHDQYFQSRPAILLERAVRRGWANEGHSCVPLVGLEGVEGSMSTPVVIEQPATIPNSMPRPLEPPELDPRQPKAVLGWTMRQLRRVAGWSGARIAREFGCSPSHISRVEHGTSKPSRELVQFYEEAFEADGLLLSLFEVVEHAAEQGRRRSGGHRPRFVHAEPGDASTFVSDTIPHGTAMKPGEWFEKEWRIRNSGKVLWMGRQLERQGPLTGPGLITSPRYVPIPDTGPRKIAKIRAKLRAPSYDCTSIAYFKMVRTLESGQVTLCFPGDYQLGLDVLVKVRQGDP
jgi:transcriptional regulator with XRE-family HTH domain